MPLMYPVCDSCRGAGFLEGIDGERFDCHPCAGTGTVDWPRGTIAPPASPSASSVTELRPDLLNQLAVDALTKTTEALHAIISLHAVVEAGRKVGHGR